MQVKNAIAHTRKYLQHSYSDERLLLQYLQTLQNLNQNISASDLQSLENLTGIPVYAARQVIDFYSFLTYEDPVSYRILVSDNIVDQYQGSRELMRWFKQHLDDRHVAVGTTSCIGLSDLGPGILVNGRLISRVTESRRESIRQLIQTRTPLSAWPAEFFQVNHPIRKSGLLLDDQQPGGTALAAFSDYEPEQALQTIQDSGLRGRGGAGFSTATKWRFCRQETADSKVVICNADEGEPGTFKDYVLLKDKINLVIEGMIIAAKIINADKGFIYLRGEYLTLMPHIYRALESYRSQGWLSGSFDIDIHLGAGAYICGEESALIESLEGKPGIPRNRPPFPVNSGYCGLPTIVNNVETFANVSLIFIYGAEHYRQHGSKNSSGTKVLSVSGDCRHPGIYELSFGTRLSELLQMAGATEVQAVQIGGAAGHLIKPEHFGRRFDFDDLATAGAVMIFNQQRKLLDVASNFADFFVHESCGFCTPCRVGTTVQSKILHRFQHHKAAAQDHDNLQKLVQLLKASSHCGLGSSAGWISESLLNDFPEVFNLPDNEQASAAFFDIDTALLEARNLAGHQ